MPGVLGSSNRFRGTYRRVSRERAGRFPATNAGVYAARAAIERLPDSVPASFEKDVIPTCYRAPSLRFPTDEDIDTAFPVASCRGRLPEGPPWRGDNEPDGVGHRRGGTSGRSCAGASIEDTRSPCSTPVVPAMFPLDCCADPDFFVKGDICDTALGDSSRNTCRPPRGDRRSGVRINLTLSRW
jgi:hypothetical protein